MRNPYPTVAVPIGRIISNYDYVDICNIKILKKGYLLMSTVSEKTRALTSENAMGDMSECLQPTLKPVGLNFHVVDRVCTVSFPAGPTRFAWVKQMKLD